MKRLRPLLCAIAAAALLVGCSDGGGSALPDRSADASRSAAPTRPEPSRAEVTAPEATRPQVVAPPTKADQPVAVQTTTTVEVTVSAAVVPPPTTSTSTSDSETPWGWLLVGLLLIGAVVLGIVQHRRGARRWAAWQQSARRAVDEARLSRDLLPAHGRDITDEAQWEQVRAGVEQADRDLRAAATAAPHQDAARAALSTAESLTSLTFGLESARLLVASEQAPSAAQLAEADAVTRTSRAELDAALARLTAMTSGAPETAGV